MFGGIWSKFNLNKKGVKIKSPFFCNYMFRGIPHLPN